MAQKVVVKWSEEQGKHIVKAILPNGNAVTASGSNEYRIFITLIERINAHGYFVNVSDTALNEIEVIKA